MDILRDKLEHCQRLIRSGELEQAAAQCRAVLADAPGHAGALNLLGCISFRDRQPQEAELAYRKAIEVAPGCATLHLNLGRVLAATGRTAPAVESLRRAVALRPASPDGLVALAQALLARAELDEAETVARRSLELAPARADAHRLLGSVLCAAGRPHEALLAFEAALAQRPDDALALDRLAGVQRDLGLLDDALESHLAALALRPEDAGMRFNQALSLLTDGRFEAGWAAYDARPQREHRFGCPQWRGESLSGCHIVLHSDHGLADAIQFVRYAPLLKRLAAEVSLECAGALRHLFATARGIDRLVDDGAALAADYHCPLASLPRILRTDAGSLPVGVPYLSAPPDVPVAGRDGLDQIDVALVWRGQPDTPGAKPVDCPLHLFEPALAMHGLRFHSFQADASAEEAELLARWGVSDLSPLLADLARAAARIDGFDLVIAVDSPIAHLAGALGKPVWLIERFDGDWRWQRMREDSPWYPTLRIFRQKRYGEWLVPTGRVAIELARVVGGESGLGTPPPAAAPERERVFLPPQPLPADARAVDVVHACRYALRMRLPPTAGPAECALRLYREVVAAELERLFALLRRGDTVIDASAGFGARALALAQRVGTRGRLLAFEAEPSRFALLEANLRENRLPQAQAQCAALAPAAGARTTSVDALGLQELRLIRMDVDAHSAELLRGARETLRSLRPLVHLAGGEGERLADWGAFMTGLDYRLYHCPVALFNPANGAGIRRNIFGDAQLSGVLCVPREAQDNAAGLREIVAPPGPDAGAADDAAV